MCLKLTGIPVKMLLIFSSFCLTRYLKYLIDTADFSFFLFKKFEKSMNKDCLWRVEFQMEFILNTLCYSN